MNLRTNMKLQFQGIDKKIHLEYFYFLVEICTHLKMFVIFANKDNALLCENSLDHL